MNRIIGVGNRLVPDDALGPLVVDQLLAGPFHAGDSLEVIDGGVGGLNLLSLVDNCGRVVFVDRLRGFAEAGEVVVLTGEQVADLAPPSHGHGAGLPYLLRAMPVACENPPVEVWIVGTDGSPSPKNVESVAHVALQTAGQGGGS